MFGWLWLRLSSRRETSGCSFIDFIFYLISSGVTLFPCSSSSQGCYGLLMFNRAEHVNVSDTRKRETNNTHNFAQHSSFLSPSSSSYFWYTVHFVNRRTTDRDFPSKGTSFLFSDVFLFESQGEFCCSMEFVYDLMFALLCPRDQKAFF